LIVILIILSIAAGMFAACANKEKEEEKSEDTQKEETIKVSGVVEYVDVEGGFYKVGEYRLIGDMDFSQYEGKKLEVEGIVDNSPNAYMTKGIKVTNLVVLEDKKEASVSGIFTGIIDPHSFEMKTDEGKMLAFNMTDVENILREKNIDVNDKIEVTYKMEGETYNALDIKLLQEEKAENKFKKEAVLVGIIDNNSFEAEVDGKPNAFRMENISEEFERLNINDGDRILIEWEVNEYNQNIVLSIEKI
jgi:hypothetical protein